MRMRRWFYTLLGCASFSSHVHSAETLEHEGARYHLFRVKPAEWHRLQLAWQGEDGKPLMDFNGLAAHLQRQHKRLLFGTNAGIYARGPVPCGLTMAQGQVLVPLNLQPGEGNFYLKPNGVFFLDDVKGPGVMEASEYARSGLRPRLATQSGPLLLRHGHMHPAFRPASPNKRLRNAVGVRQKDREIIFVMSDRDDSVKGRVTFHQLSTFFLHLGCQDALYLDGDISTLIVEPALNTRFVSNTFAAMFYIAE